MLNPPKKTKTSIATTTFSHASTTSPKRSIQIHPLLLRCALAPLLSSNVRFYNSSSIQSSITTPSNGNFTAQPAPKKSTSSVRSTTNSYRSNIHDIQSSTTAASTSDATGDYTGKKFRSSVRLLNSYTVPIHNRSPYTDSSQHKGR